MFRLPNARRSLPQATRANATCRLASHAQVAVRHEFTGLNLLISKLEALRNSGDHSHLLTPSWAGDTLTEEKQGADRYKLVHHLRSPWFGHSFSSKSRVS
ncbi:immunity protein 32 [Sinorhizobium meliloti]